MSDLSYTEKHKLERLLDMGSGGVLNFSNRTLREFVQDSVMRDIYDARYMHGSGSKANRLRGFWMVECNSVVGKLLMDLIEYVNSAGGADQATLTDCQRIVARLMRYGTVQEVEALTDIGDESGFEVITKSLQGLIESNQLEEGLDRLHTYAVMFVRLLCQNKGITVDREKPLHSLFGEYVKTLKKAGHIESLMTERILKGSISVLDAFNDVRNTKSLAHDNQLLNYEEALLIFNHVAGSIRFLRSIESKIQKSEPQTARIEIPTKVINADPILNSP